LNVKVITGGHTKRQIVNPVFEENDIIIATLGALSKLTNTGMMFNTYFYPQTDFIHCIILLGIYSMRYVRHVVLDEADTLMDDSFNELMTRFLSRFQVQILFFKLLKNICNNTVFNIFIY